MHETQLKIRYVISCAALLIFNFFFQQNFNHEWWARVKRGFEKEKKRKRAALMTYPSHALSKTRGLLATKCYSTWRQMIWWQWTMGECKKILPKEIVSNKNMRSDKWQIGLFKMRWDAVEVLLSPSWAASQAPLIFQKGSAETFHLSIKLQKLLFICERSRKVLSGRLESEGRKWRFQVSDNKVQV